MSLITSRMAKILMDSVERLKKSSTGGSREIENFRDLSSRIDFRDIDK